jgi:Flp pilus assembly protein TadG
MKRVQTKLRGLVRDTRGTEIAEAAVVLPLLFIVLIAVFWFGQAFRIYGTLAHAARQGARAAVAPVCATCPAAAPGAGTQNAITAVTNAMTAAHLSTQQLVPLGSWTPPALCSCGSSNSSCSGGNAVACDTTFSSSNVCVQTNVQLSYSSPSPGGAGTCGTSVSLRYKYPYRFKLPCWPQPCTPLDLSNLSLPGQAQMRLETQ